MQVAKSREDKMKKKVGKQLAQEKMQESSAKNPDDFEVRKAKGKE